MINKQDGRLQAIINPLVLQEWEKMLAGYLGQRFGNYLLSGIREGFRVGFNPSGLPSLT